MQRPAPPIRPKKAGPPPAAGLDGAAEPAAAPRRPAPKAAPREDRLVITGLAKSFRRRTVVRDVSLTLGRGEAVGLLGPNGAGKTTLFYMITGLIRPDRGTISIDG